MFWCIESGGEKLKKTRWFNRWSRNVWNAECFLNEKILLEDYIGRKTGGRQPVGRRNMAQQDRVLFLARKQLHFDWFPFLDIVVKKRKRKKKIIAIVRNFSSNFFILFFLFYIYIYLQAESAIIATLLISLLQFRGHRFEDFRKWKKRRRGGKNAKERK